MADANLEINVAIEEALKAIKEFGKIAEKTLDGVEKEAKDTGKSLSKNLSEGFKDLGSTVKSGMSSAIDGIFSLKTALIGVAGFFSARAIANGIEDVTKAAAAQQDAINKLNTALSLAGDFSDSASKDLQSYAQELEKTSKNSSEAALNSLALAKNFGVSNEEAKKLVKAGAELAAVTGVSLEQAVGDLGKTLDGTAGRLSETIPGLRGLSEEALKSGDAIDFVLKRFGGAAAAELNTFSGAQAQVANAFDDIKKAIGAVIVDNPAVIAGLKVLTDLFGQISDAVSSNKSTLQGFVSDFIRGIIENIPAALNAIASLIDAFGFITIAIQPIAFAIQILFDKIGTGAALIVQNVITVFSGLKVAILAPINLAIQGLEKLGLVSKEFADEFSKTYDGAVSDAAHNVSASVAGIVDQFTTLPEDSTKSFFDKTAQGAINLGEKLRGAAESTKGLVAEFDKLKDQKFPKLENQIKTSIQASVQASVELAGPVLIDKSIFEKVQNQFQLMSAKISQSFDSIVAKSQPAIDSIKAVGSVFQSVFQGMQAGITALANAGSAIVGGIAAATGKSIEENSKAVGTAIQGLIGPVFDQIASGLGGFVGGLLSLANQTPEKLKSQIDGFLAAIPQFINSIVENIPMLVQTLVSEVIPALADALPVILEIFAEAIPQIIQSLANALPDLINKIAELLPDLLISLVNILTDPNFINSIIDAIGNLITALIDALPTILDAIIKSLPVMIRAIVRQIPKIIVSIIKAIPMIITSILEALPDIIFEIINAIPTIIQGLIEALPELLVSVVGGILRALPNIIAGFIKLIPRLIVSIFQNITKLLGTIFSQIGSALGGIFGNVGASFIATLKKFLVDIPKQIDAKIREFLKKFLITVPQQFLKNLLSGLGAGIKKIFDKIKPGGSGDFIGKGAKKIGSALGGVKLAEGIGEVPKGFPNDTFAARLTSGERVVPTDTNNQLQRFLDQNTDGPSTTDALLVQVITLLSKPMVVNTTATIKGQALADIILELSRNNARLTA
jgi:phage-related protein